MRKMLGIVAMLVVALVISADLPRAGPDDQVDNVVMAMEHSNSVTINDLNVNSVTTDLGVIAVFALDATTGLRREEVVHQNPSDVQLIRGYNEHGISGYLTTFRNTHRPWTWHPLLT